MPVEAIDVVVTSDNAVVPRVRFLARQVGAVLGCRIDVDLVALLTTEVLSNAVREATGQVVAVFSMPSPDRLRVEVSDRSPRNPEVLHPGPLDDGGHRGLMVVERLASAWGVERRPVGKTVWFEVWAAPPFADGQHGATTAAAEGTPLPGPRTTPTPPVPISGGPEPGHDRRSSARRVGPAAPWLGPERRAPVATSASGGDPGCAPGARRG